MALHYILDGYNIIKSDGSGALAQGSLEQQRNRLITLIKERRPQGSEKNAITVVFDGPSSLPHVVCAASRYHVGDIEILFSEGNTADAVIEQLVAESSRPSDLIIVTSDRGLHRLVGGTGARVMTAEEFRNRIHRGGARDSSNKGRDTADDISVHDINEEFRKKWL